MNHLHWRYHGISKPSRDRGKLMADLTKPSTSPTLTGWGWNTVAKQILAPIFLAPLILWLAKDWRWPTGWAFNVAHAFVWTANTVILLRFHPELLNARGRGTQSDTKTWDVVLLSLYGIAWLSMLIVGALDHRFGWSAEMPLVLVALGLLLMIVGFGFTTWAMVENRHFELSVRIQEDRDHRVYTGGPYQFMRHPGYTGVILSFFVGMPLALASWTAFIPALVGAIVMIVRTYLEDMTLQRELDGYTDFTAQTRYRLLPGVW
jgi:protein-S-isoprenylcysteine O-methyltransferase Ste14